MGGPLLGKKGRGARSKEVAGLPSLVRRLVQRASTEPPPTPGTNSNGSPRVILDLEVDGVRCTLVRSDPKHVHNSLILSPREQEIARMVANGYPNKTIAGVLEISSWTVCTHLRRIFAKLGVGTRAAMVARLLHEGLIRND